MGDSNGGAGSAVCCYLALLIYGSILLAHSLEYQNANKYVGTLRRTDTYGSGDDSKVKEYFRYQHSGKNTTCTIIRDASYANKKKANAAAEKKKLGTTRQIYVSTKDENKCIDDMSKINGEYTAGIVLLSLFGLPIFLAGAFCCFGCVQELLKVTESDPVSTTATPATEGPTPQAAPAEPVSQVKVVSSGYAGYGGVPAAEDVGVAQAEMVEVNMNEDL
jgi:hypothetical protein